MNEFDRAIRIDEEALAPAVKELFARARLSEMDPEQFYRALAGLDVSVLMRMAYTRAAFGLPIPVVKEMGARIDNYSDDWIHELIECIAEMETEGLISSDPPT